MFTILRNKGGEIKRITSERASERCRQKREDEFHSPNHFLAMHAFPRRVKSFADLPTQNLLI